VEPKYEKDLNPVMKAYRSVIEESPSEQYRTACGAIFFAVFRAKVAEGIDFSDNEARCVLAVRNIFNIDFIYITRMHTISNIIFLRLLDWHTVSFTKQ